MWIVIFVFPFSLSWCWSIFRCFCIVLCLHTLTWCVIDCVVHCSYKAIKKFMTGSRQWWIHGWARVGPSPPNPEKLTETIGLIYFVIDNIINCFLIRTKFDLQQRFMGWYLHHQCLLKTNIISHAALDVFSLNFIKTVPSIYVTRNEWRNFPVHGFFSVYS